MECDLIAILLIYRTTTGFRLPCRVCPLAMVCDVGVAQNWAQLEASHATTL